jgi:HEAT repeat protein
MQHQHPVMRYWGATGCTIQGEATAAAMSQLKKLLDDPSPAVRVAAAEALYVLGEKKTGFDGLIDILKETNDPVVSLEALNVTQALGVMNDVPRDVWARACTTGGYSKRMAGDQDDPNLQR